MVLVTEHPNPETKLTLNLGYSHPVEMIDPEGVETVLEGQTKSQ